MAEALWKLQDRKGHFYGPFTTSKIMELISKGFLKGDELVCPEGTDRWIEITNYPEFYDAIEEAGNSDQAERTQVEIETALTNLTERPRKRGRVIIEDENSPPPRKPSHTSTSSDEKTKVSSGSKKDIPTKKERRKKRRGISQQKSPFARLKDQFIKPIFDNGGHRTPTGPQFKPPVIDLKEEQVIFRSQRKKNRMINVVLILAVAFFGFLVLSSLENYSSNPEGKTRLLYPTQKASPRSLEETQSMLKQSLAEFQKDDFSGYYKALQILVSLLESNPKNLDAISLLCLTYRELWPFAYQDSEDLRNLTRLVQMAQSENSLGVHAATCRAIQVSITSENEALDSVLQPLLTEFPTAAVLYELKAQTLASSQDYSTAIGFVQKTQSLWPGWLKAFFVEGQIRDKMEDYYTAAKIYKNILDSNPNHSKSQVELGVLELTRFNNPKGLDRILVGLSDSKVPSGILVKGYGALVNHYIQSQPEKALEYAKKAYGLDPRNTTLRNVIITLGGEAALTSVRSEDTQLMLLGDSYFRNKNYLAAQAEYKTAFEMNPKNATAALKAGESLWNINQTNEAINWTLKALRADPKLVESYVQLSDYYSQKYDFKSAASFLSKARSENKLTYQMLRAFAQLELRRRSLPTAEKYAEQALRLYDADVPSLTILAEALMMQNQPEKAFQYAAKAVSLDGNNARAQEIYAETLRGLRGGEAGEQYLAELINTYPDNIEYRVSLGGLLLKEQRYGEAIGVLKHATQSDPSSMKGHMLLGSAYTQSGDLNEALKTYFKASSLDPSGAAPLFEIGQVYLKNPSTFAKALSSFQKVIETNPNYPKAYYYAGRAAFQLGMTKQAIEYAEREKKVNPKLADPYILLADIYFSQQRFAPASAELRRAVQLRPDDSSLYVQLARTHRLAGQLDAAAGMLRVAASKESGNAEIYREQGAVFERLGLSDQALAAYTRYLELKPNAEDRNEVRARISSLGG